jgi:hypothetical protein
MRSLHFPSIKKLHERRSPYDERSTIGMGKGQRGKQIPLPVGCPERSELCVGGREENLRGRRFAPQAPQERSWRREAEIRRVEESQLIMENRPGGKRRAASFRNSWNLLNSKISGPTLADPITELPSRPTLDSLGKFGSGATISLDLLAGAGRLKNRNKRRGK